MDLSRRLRIHRLITQSVRFNSDRVKKNEPKKTWEKKSFLSLVTNRETSKVLNLLKAVNVQEEDEEDVFKQKESGFHPIHPELLNNDDEKKPPGLLNHIFDNHFRKLVVGDYTEREIRIGTLVQLIEELHSKTEFPFPPKLTVLQWQNLLGYDSIFGMAEYLLASIQNHILDEQIIQSIKEIDEQAMAPLSIAPEVYDNVIGDNRRLQKQWTSVCDIFDEMRLEGVPVIGDVSYHQILTLLKMDTDDINSVQNYLKALYEHRKERLFEYISERLLDMKETESRSTFILPCLSLLEERICNCHQMRLYSDITTGTAQTCILDVSIFENMDYYSRGQIFGSTIQWFNKSNQMSNQPFKLHFTNVKSSEPAYNLFNLKVYRERVVQRHPFDNWSQHTPINLYNRRKLLVISPHSKNEFVYDPDDIYVFHPTLANSSNDYALKWAQKESLKHAHIPVQKYGGLTNNLPVDILLRILLDYRTSKNWSFAMRWISPEFYGVVLKSTPVTHFQEYHILARQKLYPKEMYSNNYVMTSNEYIQMLNRYTSLAPEDDGYKHYSRIYYKTKRRDKFKTRNDALRHKDQ